MHTRTLSSLAIFVLLLTTIGSSQARAEMGFSPAGPGQHYVTLFGGYVNSSGTASPGHGSIINPNTQFLFEVEDGGFVGLKGGYVIDALMPLGLKNFRIEGGFAANIFDDLNDSDAVGTIIDMAGTGPANGANPRTRKSREVYDLSIAVKGDKQASANDPGAALGLELFFRRSEDKTRSIVGASFRNHDVDGRFFGALFVVQPEVALTPSLSLVADLGGGIYGVEGEAKSQTNINFDVTLKNKKSTVGFRGRAMGGLRFDATDAISLTVFGGVDYWSDVPVVNQVRTFGATPPSRSVKFNDLVEIKAGLSLTMTFGG